MLPPDHREVLGTTLECHGRTLHVSKLLGAGSFGSVLLATDVKTGERFALKLLDRNPNTTTESILHSYVSPHPNILRWHASHETNFFTMFLLEYISTGTLHDLLYPALPTSDAPRTPAHLPSELITSLILQLLAALDCCHSRMVFHRDIKPENILLYYPDGDRAALPVLKLADFGLATTEKETKAFRCGSEGFMSPECECKTVPWEGPADVKSYEPRKSDVWAVGMVLMLLITGGRKPWLTTLPRSPHFPSFLASPRSYLRSVHPSITEPALDLVLEMLEPNPAHRTTSLSYLSARAKEVVEWSHPLSAGAADGDVPGWNDLDAEAEGWVKVRRVKRRGGQDEGVGALDDWELMRVPVVVKGTYESEHSDPTPPPLLSYKWGASPDSQHPLRTATSYKSPSSPSPASSSDEDVHSDEQTAGAVEESTSDDEEEESDADDDDDDSGLVYELRRWRTGSL